MVPRKTILPSLILWPFGVRSGWVAGWLMGKLAAITLLEFVTPVFVQLLQTPA